MGAFVQSVPTSTVQKKTLTLFSYAGGLDNVSSYSTTLDECATDVLNMEFLEDGLIQKRHGTKIYQENTFPSDVKFVDRFCVEGEEEKLIVSTDTQVFVNNTPICTVAHAIKGVTFRNTYLFVDGEKLRAYSKNETTNEWEVNEVVSPTNLESTLTAKGEKGKNTITVADGTKFTAKQWIQIGEYVKDSSVTPLTARVLSVSGNTITLGETQTITYIKVNSTDGTQTTETREDNVPTYLQFDYEVGTKVTLFEQAVDYKYEGDVVTADGKREYRPCVYELEDAYKGINSVPTHPIDVTLHKDAIYIVSADHPSNIYISHQNNMYYYPVVKYASVPANGDEIVGLISFNDSLVIARRNDMHVLYGVTNNPNNGEQYNLKKITTHTGCISGNTLRVVHNYLFYLGSDGIAYKMCTTNTDIRLLTTQVLSVRVDFKKQPFNYTLEQMKTACATFTNNNYYLSIQDKVFIYSYRFMAWTVFDGLDCTYMFSIDDEVLWSKKDKLMQFDKETYLDEGRAYLCYWKSKLFDLGTPTIYKYFKYISLVFDTYEAYDSTVNIIFEIDYEDVKSTYTFKNSISRWGTAQWGDRYANRNITKSEPIYIGRRGRGLKVCISNGYKIDVEFQTIKEMADNLKLKGTVCYNYENDTHYIMAFDEEMNAMRWTKIETEQINQPIKLYNVEIEYSLRGRH